MCERDMSTTHLFVAVVSASRRGTKLDLEAKDAQGNTALFYAFRQKSGKLAKALVALGAKNAPALERKASGTSAVCRAPPRN